MIDRNYERSKRGHVCSVCGVASEAGRIAFPLNVHVLVDLVQQVYHSESKVDLYGGPHAADIGSVLYYCTLREGLLNLSMTTNLRARHVPEPLISKLLGDNRLANQRFGELFSSVFDMKWDAAVAEVSETESFDFRGVSTLMQAAAKSRNRFLHEGHAWEVTRDFATRCVNSMAEMVELFVAIHNAYTHPIVLKTVPGHREREDEA